jgi:hypothetical protein
MADQYALDPAALGSHGNANMRELGFDDLQYASPKTEDLHVDARKRITPLTKLTEKLFKELDFGVEIAASLAIEDLPEGEDMGGFDCLQSKKFLLIKSISEASCAKLREV